MANWRGLRARIERQEHRRELLRTDVSPWDWYADRCPCGVPVGMCPRHPRVVVII